MTAEPNRRIEPATDPVHEPEVSGPSLPERLLQALSEAGPPNQMAAGLIERIRSGGAAVRAAAPASLNPSQILMNRLRPSRMLEKAADQELRPMGFGLYGAMAVDFIARQATPPRLADISRFLMQEPQSLTTLIQRLERRGWIRREPSEFDRRAVLLELTEAGRQLHERLVRVLERVLQDFEAENFEAENIGAS
jgi:DNA-binding MarR family transcriptional regulator